MSSQPSSSTLTLAHASLSCLPLSLFSFLFFPQRERERERERQTDRQTERERERDRQTDRRQTDRQRVISV